MNSTTLQELLKEGGANKQHGVKSRLENLRRMLLLSGFPSLFSTTTSLDSSESETEKQQLNEATTTKKTRLRGRLWKVLLCVEHIDSNLYISLVQRGQLTTSLPLLQAEIMKSISMVCGDPTARAASGGDSTNDSFSASLLRVLTSLCHFIVSNKRADSSSSYSSSSSTTTTLVKTIPGISLITSLLLQEMSEPDAFETIKLLTIYHYPMIFIRNDGADSCSELCLFCLSILDPALYHFVMSKMNPLPIKLFSEWLLCLGIRFAGKNKQQQEKQQQQQQQPFETNSSKQLVDFIFAFGLHITPIVLISSLILNRSSIIHTLSNCPYNCNQQQAISNKQLLFGYNFETNKVISLCCSLIPKIPENLWSVLLNHTIMPTSELLLSSIKTCSTK